MAVPKKHELYNPIIGFLGVNGESSICDIRKAMAEYFYLNEDEAYAKKEEQKYSTFERRVNGACEDLYHAALLIRVKIGTYDLSDKAKETIEKKKDVDRAVLWQSPEFEEFIKPKTPNYAPKKKEYDFVDLEEVKVCDVITLKQQDTRVANMLSLGIYMLADQQICAIPQEVLQHDMTLAEYNSAESSSVSKPSKIIVSKDANGSKKVIAKTGREGSHRGSYNKYWNKPDPFIQNGINRAFNLLNDFKKLNSMKAALDKLVNEYNISDNELSRRTGLSSSQIRDWHKKDLKTYDFDSLMKILVRIGPPVAIAKYIIGLAGYDSNSSKCNFYLELIELAHPFTAPEINKICADNNMPPLFDATVTF